jgi:hypothetical protein
VTVSAQLIQLRNIYVNGCSELEELPGLAHLRFEVVGEVVGI